MQMQNKHSKTIQSHTIIRENQYIIRIHACSHTNIDIICIVVSYRQQQNTTAKYYNTLMQNTSSNSNTKRFVLECILTEIQERYCFLY